MFSPFSSFSPFGRRVAPSGGGGSGFSPTDIAGLQLWLSDTGASAATWPDLSGNGNNATQASAGSQPSIQSGVLNGKQVRRFDGSNDFMDFGSMITLSDCTVFVVEASTGDGILLGRSDDNYQFRLGEGGNNYLSYYVNDGVSGSSRASLTVSRGVFRMITFQKSGTGSNCISCWENGASVTMAANPPQSHSSTWNQLGIFFSSALPLNGDVAEIVIYDTALGSTDRGNVETYLSAKYAL